jgi:hypothetical protein
MLEILLLFSLCKHLGVITREKGLKPLKYQVILVVLWLGVETVISTSAYISLFFLYGEDQSEPLVYAFYFLGLMCSAISTWIFFNYIKSLPNKKTMIRV